MKTVIGQLVYRGSITVELERVDYGEHLALVLQCPMCYRRARLNPAAHQVLVDVHERVTIDRPVLCPNRECGWHVRIVAGNARDVEAKDAGAVSVRASLRSSPARRSFPARASHARARLARPPHWSIR